MAHSPGLARTIIMVPTGGWNYSWLEPFFMIPSLFEPLRFYCTIFFLNITCDPSIYNIMEHSDLTVSNFMEIPLVQNGLNLQKDTTQVQQ